MEERRWNSLPGIRSTSILLDIVMPELDGFGVLAALKQNVDTCNIPVIMISALQEAESAARCIERRGGGFPEQAV